MTPLMIVAKTGDAIMADVSIMLLLPAYVVSREGNVLQASCLSVCPRGEGGTSVSGPRSVLQPVVPDPFLGSGGYPSQVLGQGYLPSPFPPPAITRTGLPHPPNHNEDRDTSSLLTPLPTLDSTCHGQDTQRALRLLRSSKRTFLFHVFFMSN